MNSLSTFRNALQAFDTNQLTPFAVGFDRTFDRLWDYASHNLESTGFPPYNIRKDGEYNYVIELALAGFSKNDIEVEVAEGVLTVKSVKDVSDGTDDKLYSGIANRQFTRKFTLSDDIVVKDGELKDGMLRITLERVIPEEKKPRMITIK